MHNIAAVAATYVATVTLSVVAFLAGLVPSGAVAVVSLMAMCGVLGFALGYSAERRQQVHEAISRIRVWASLH